MKRPWIAWGLAAAVVAVGVAVGAVSLRGPLVDAVVVQSAPLVRTLQFSARVATLSRVDVGSTLTGRVAQVRVAEGAQVRQGDVLVQLESDELRAALAQAVASERQAQARLTGLRSSGRTAAQAASAQANATLQAANASLRGCSSWWPMGSTAPRSSTRPAGRWMWRGRSSSARRRRCRPMPMPAAM